MKKIIIPCLAIAAVAVIEITAICHGIDGVLLGACVFTIGGIAGYTAKGQAQKIGN